MKSLSPVRLFESPWTAAHQAPLSMGFSRQEDWSGVPLLSPLDPSCPSKWSNEAPAYQTPEQWLKGQQTGECSGVTLHKQLLVDCDFALGPLVILGAFPEAQVLIVKPPPSMTSGWKHHLVSVCSCIWGSYRDQSE